MSTAAHPHPHANDLKVPVGVALAVATITTGVSIIGITWQADHHSSTRGPEPTAQTFPPHRTTFRGGAQVGQ